MDQQFSQPKPIKPGNSSKPPVKSWSELLSNNSATSTAISVNTSNIISKHSNSSISSGTNSTNSSRPPSTITLEVDFESLKLENCPFPDTEFLYSPLNYVQSRPIINPGNRCYMISVLQVILHTRLFSNYLSKYFFKLDQVDSILENMKFPLLRALKNFYQNFVNTRESSVVSHEVIDEIFLALKMKNSFTSAGFAEQEDAEEFLTAFLDSLGDEFLGIQGQKLISFSLPFESEKSGFLNEISQETGDDWLQVGPKQRVATTRRTPVSLSPIHTLFSGSFQSLYRSPGVRPSITFEPFTILPLSLVINCERGADICIDSIDRAIDHVLRCEDLGRKCSKQLSFSSLPPVLIIQLKRFIYKQTVTTSTELFKLTKPLKVPSQLNLSQSIFKLYAAVNHHGSNLNTGHYTATILTEKSDKNNNYNNNNNNSNGTWLLFDDETRIQKANEEGIFNQNSSAYLLFYERQLGR